MWKRLKRVWNSYKNVAAVRGFLQWIGYWQSGTALASGILAWLWSRVRHLSGPLQLLVGLGVFAFVLVSINVVLGLIDRAKRRPKIIEDDPQDKVTAVAKDLLAFLASIGPRPAPQRAVGQDELEFIRYSSAQVGPWLNSLINGYARRFNDRVVKAKYLLGENNVVDFSLDAAINAPKNEDNIRRIAEKLLAMASRLPGKQPLPLIAGDVPMIIWQKEGTSGDGDFYVHINLVNKNDVPCTVNRYWMTVTIEGRERLCIGFPAPSGIIKYRNVVDHSELQADVRPISITYDKPLKRGLPIDGWLKFHVMQCDLGGERVSGFWVVPIKFSIEDSMGAKHPIDFPYAIVVSGEFLSAGSASTVKANGPPITLKQLFELDWQNLPAFYNECVLSSPIFESGSVKVAWRVNGDFVGRSKFLAILIDPTTKASDAYRACEAIADRYGHFIDSPNSEVDIQGQAPDDTAPTHLKDMVFSKRIFIYYEDFSLAQKGMLETIYQSKELSVQFRDAAYAWAHRDDKPRQTPLVPNSTILPDAKLNAGLKITVTKLSPSSAGGVTVTPP